MTFSLHPQLDKDSILLAHFRLSQLRLLNDAQYPWFLLVPERTNVAEIIDLQHEEQVQLWTESSILSQSLRQLYKPDRLNVAAIGNMVPQLHMHHVVRYKDDACWPKPIWGQLRAIPYAPGQTDEITRRLKPCLPEWVKWAE